MLKLSQRLFWRIGDEVGEIASLSAGSLLLSQLSNALSAKTPCLRELVVENDVGDVQLRARGTLTRSHDGTSAVLFTPEDSTSVKALDDFVGRVRKEQHIDLCRDVDVETREKAAGFAELNFIPQAVPELNWDELDCRGRFLAREFSAPLFISGMTGGVARGEQINRNLAYAASTLGLPMGVGSQRIACENPDFTAIFAVKEHYPDVFLCGNLGCAQLVAPQGLKRAEQAIAMIAADALVIHVNVLQECLQVEGNRNFRGLLDRLAELCALVRVPVIVKEVGCGMSPDTAEALLATGISALDIAGKGGTSWGYIEGLRSNNLAHQNLAASFRDWGIPTAYSLAALRSRFPEAALIASGGIRDGLTLAKALALGADMVGIALPLLQAALISKEAVVESLEKIIEGLKITMLACGARTPAALAPRLCLGQPLRQEFLDRVTKPH